MLEDILIKEFLNRKEDGMFGIRECESEIEEDIKRMKDEDRKNALCKLLDEYIKRGNEDVFFNKTMILACWEMLRAEI